MGKDEKKAGSFTHIETSRETFVKKAIINNVESLRIGGDDDVQFSKTIKELFQVEAEEAFRNVLTEAFPAVYQRLDKKHLKEANEAIVDKRFEDALGSLESIGNKTGKIHYQKGITEDKLSLYSAAADSFLEAFKLGESSLDEIIGVINEMPRFSIDSNGEVAHMIDSFSETALALDIEESKLLTMKGYFSRSNNDKRKYLKRALKSDPKEVQAMWGLFYLYNYDEDPKAFKYANKLLSSDKDTDNLYYNLCFWMFRMYQDGILAENKDPVLKLVKRIKKELPDDMKYCREWKTIGVVYEELGLQDEADKLDEKYLEADYKTIKKNGVLKSNIVF